MKPDRLALAFIIAGIVAAMAPASPLRATTQRATTLEELAHASDVIVRGTVIDVVVHSTGPGGRPGIHTEVRIGAEEFLAGAPVSVVTLWVHGGRIGNRARVVAGQARFEVSENVVVFLFDAGGGALFPTGMAQGKWRADDRAVISPQGGAIALSELRTRTAALVSP